MAQNLDYGFCEKGWAKQLGLDDLNDFSELWAVGVVSSCPVPGLDDLGQGKYWLGVCSVQFSSVQSLSHVRLFATP